MPQPQHAADDPLGLERIDRDIKHNELAERLHDLGMSSGGLSPDCPPEIAEAFVARIEAYEKAEFITHVEQLRRVGVELPPPEALGDADLPAKLHDIFEGLARNRVYVANTNHLRDRELYEHLYHDSLREDVPDLPPTPGGAHVLDLVGSGSEEDSQAYLRYYADDEARARAAEQYPDEPVPPREPCPADRDRTLPRPADMPWWC